MSTAKLILEANAALEEQQAKIRAVILAHERKFTQLLAVLPRVHAEAVERALPDLTARLEKEIPEILAADLLEAKKDLTAENAAQVIKLENEWKESRQQARLEIQAEIARLEGELTSTQAELDAKLHARITEEAERIATEQLKAASLDDKIRAQVLAAQETQRGELLTLAAATNSAIFADLFKGVYEPGTQAKRGELYTWGGNLFLCIRDTTTEPKRTSGLWGMSPNATFGDWQLLVPAGPPGPAGSTAAAGSSLPDMAGNAGKFLTNDNITASWAALTGGGDLLSTNNLDDLDNVAVARTNLGLGGAAVLEVGDTSGTVAAGDDSRIAGSLQAANDLSDLDNVATARGNLGLGDSAVLNVGTGADNVAAGDHTHTGVYEPANANIQLHIASTSNPHAVTKAQVGLDNVTDDAQTKAAIVPNDAPNAGSILVGNAGGTAYAMVAVSGDLALDNTGTATIANNVVTNAKLYSMAANTFKARKTQSLGAPEDISILELQMLTNPLTLSAYTDTCNVGENDAAHFCTLSNANAKVITVLRDNQYTTPHPNNSSILYCQTGAGQWTFSPFDTGINVASRGQALKMAGQFSFATLYKAAPNQWYLIGDITA